MQSLRFKGKFPQIHSHSHIFPGVQLIGDVTIEKYASIWPNAVLRGDINHIVVGKYSNVQDNAVLHVEDTHPCILGNYVTVGHGAIVHASVIEDEVLIGMGAVILSRCHIGRGSIIGAGAVIMENTIIPPHSLVVGVPAKVLREDTSLVTRIHNQAVKYKTVWTKEYGYLPNAGGEVWKEGDPIV